MTLDLSKPVQTRDGHPVRIFATDFKHPDRPLVGAMYRDGRERTYTWPRDGTFAVKGCGDHIFDLINVPEKVTGWVNIFSNEATVAYIHPSRSSADFAASQIKWPRIACLEITYEKGQGL